MTKADIWVPGPPQPQGSKRIGRHGGVYETPQLYAWRERVALAVDGQWKAGVARQPVRVELRFYFPRPRHHYTQLGKLRGRAPKVKATRPDLDKLIRACLDAMTGIVFADDGQVYELYACKSWQGERGPGVAIKIEVEDDQSIAQPDGAMR